MHLFTECLRDHWDKFKLLAAGFLPLIRDLQFCIPLNYVGFHFLMSNVSHETNFQLEYHYKASKHYFCRKNPSRKESVYPYLVNSADNYLQILQAMAIGQAQCL